MSLPEKATFPPSPKESTLGASAERACLAQRTASAKALGGNELSVCEQRKESQGSWYISTSPTLLTRVGMKEARRKCWCDQVKLENSIA